MQMPEYKPRVRVIDSTYSPDETKRKMIGKEYDIQVIDYKDDVYVIDFCRFNKSDLAFLTPVKYNGRFIAIGDEVKWSGRWRKVYGYHWYDGRWGLDTARDDDYNNECYSLYLEEIRDHRPLSETKISDEELIAELEKRGIIKAGKIVV